MAYTKKQLAALQDALAKGERRVTFGDKTVEYRSVEELKLAIAEVKRELAIHQRRPRQICITTNKGF